MNFSGKLFTLLISIFLTLTIQVKGNNRTESSGTIHDFEVTKNIEWAKPNGQSLTMDIYVPKTGKSNYPVLVIFHGGGWLINNKSIMDSMSTYIVEHSEFIVCNVNYRLLIDQSNTITMNQIIEDAMGAVLWIKENIAEYKGDKSKIIVTGDSAGGHLAAMVVLGGKSLETDGFKGSSFGYNPTFLPAGKTAEQVADENGLEVQAAILSYPALDVYSFCLGTLEKPSNFFWSFSGQKARGIFGNQFNATDNADMYKAVSPVFIIPHNSKQFLPPHLCLVGTEDNLISTTSIKEYVSLLQTNGHSAEYWEYEGKPHAFLDSGKNEFLGTEFRKDAPLALDRMIEFMNKNFSN